MEKRLLTGNEAIAEAAVRAGCRFFAGYPITPQSEILEYLSRRMPEVGGKFVQSESELSGISMVYGAAAAGFRTFTSSSGPGYSLLQEGISYIASAELPCVIVDVQRYGSGLGDIYVGQSDYWQAVRNGGHGDYRTIVYAPSSVQETADLIAMSFDKAEQYRNPVTVLSDASICHMMEPVELPEMHEHDPNQYDWALKGKGNGHYKRITSALYDIPDFDHYIAEKYRNIEDNEQKWESFRTEDADVVLVAYGISARICEETVLIGRENGLRLGLIRPISLYPFPRQAFRELNSRSDVRAYFSVEMTALHQMAEDVALASKMRCPIYAMDGGMTVYEPEDILKRIKSALSGKERTVFQA